MVKQCHKSPMAGNGKHTTYIHGDDWGMVNMFFFLYPQRETSRARDFFFSQAMPSFWQRIQSGPTGPWDFSERFAVSRLERAWRFPST